VARLSRSTPPRRPPLSARIVLGLPRPVRRRLENAMRKATDADLRTRVRAVLLYNAGWGSTKIAEALGCVPATVVRAVARLREYGEDGLLDRRRENGQAKVDDDVRQAVAEFIARSPEEFGWARPTWTRELLARTIEERLGVSLGETTMTRVLAALDARWGMARPIVLCPWSKRRRNRRVRQVLHAVENLPEDEVACYEVSCLS